jgi:hypothetical protein
MRAPAKVTVLLWQVSQGALVTMWLVGLPSAVTPLWQVAQPPVMPACVILAGLAVAAFVLDAAGFPAIGPGVAGLTRGARVVAGLPGAPVMAAAAFGAVAIAGTAAAAGAVVGSTLGTVIADETIGATTELGAAVAVAGAAEAGLGVLATVALGIAADTAGVATAFT